jgi:hypothetical protein
MNGNTHYALDYSYCFINSLASWILIPCRRRSDSHHPGYRGDCHSHQARDRSRCLSLRFRKASPKRMAATLFVRGAMTPCGAHNFLQYLIDFVFLHRPSRWFWVGFSSLSQLRRRAKKFLKSIAIVNYADEKSVRQKYWQILSRSRVVGRGHYLANAYFRCLTGYSKQFAKGRHKRIRHV